MGDLFWHPLREFHRLPNGWRGRRNDGLDGAIVHDGDTYRVFVRRGQEAVDIGAEPSLAEAAWLFWTHGREDRWARRPTVQR